MLVFDPQAYGEAVARLLATGREPPRADELGPGTPNRAARGPLESMTDEAMFPAGRPSDAAMAQACRAALWLYHDWLDESHRISQEIETPEGSFWHGIMHRREPDADNAKYWFRRVGEHPTFADLQMAAAELACGTAMEDATVFLVKQTRWDPFRWIDLCDVARTGRTSEAIVGLCKQIQNREWQLLFDYCYRAAR